jgi:MFS superfamily sulfate permease-like transporter
VTVACLSVSESAGVKSQMGNLIAALVCLSVIVVLLPHFECMPKAVSSSIIFVVAISLLDTHELRFIVRVRQWVDLALLVAMFGVTFLLGVDIGIFFAFAACLLMAVKQTTLPGVTMLGRGYANDDFHDLSDMDEEAQNVEGILIYKIDGPLYFANAEKLKDSTKRVSMTQHDRCPLTAVQTMRLVSVSSCVLRCCLVCLVLCRPRRRAASTFTRPRSLTQWPSPASCSTSPR